MGDAAAATLWPPRPEPPAPRGGRRLGAPDRPPEPGRHCTPVHAGALSDSGDKRGPPRSAPGPARRPKGTAFRVSFGGRECSVTECPNMGVNRQLQPPSVGQLFGRHFHLRFSWRRPDARKGGGEGAPAARQRDRSYHRAAGLGRTGQDRLEGPRRVDHSPRSPTGRPPSLTRLARGVGVRSFP